MTNKKLKIRKKLNKTMKKRKDNKKNFKNKKNSQYYRMTIPKNLKILKIMRK